MKNLRNKLRRFWLIIKNRLWETPIPLETIRVSELPDQLRAGQIYLIGENDFLWIVALLCPCGCDSAVQLNLLPDAHPRWRIDNHSDGTVSLTPSIWSKRRCDSHYFIKRGFIKWTVEE